MGVDVAPAWRHALELLAQLADEDVDRAVAVHHRVAPDALVDLLALDHVALGRGEHLDQLVLSSRQVEAGAVDERLELVAAACDRLVGARVGAPAAPDNGHDAGHQLLGMTWLGDPVVGAESEAADALGDAG